MKYTGCAGMGCLSIIVLIVAIFAYGHFFPEPIKEETREERIENLFSPWDGSHRGLTMIIKESMNDPDSYDHIETGYWDNGDHLIVKTSFRGRNAFGGIVKNWVKAKVDLKGNVIEVIGQGP